MRIVVRALQLPAPKGDGGIVGELADMQIGKY